LIPSKKGWGATVLHSPAGFKKKDGETGGEGGSYKCPKKRGKKLGCGKQEKKTGGTGPEFHGPSKGGREKGERGEGDHES